MKKLNRDQSLSVQAFVFYCVQRQHWLINIEKKHKLLNKRTHPVVLTYIR